MVNNYARRTAGELKTFHGRLRLVIKLNIATL